MHEFDGKILCKHCLDREGRILTALLFLGKTFLNHIDTNDTEKHKGDPMINGSDVFFKG